VDGFLDRPLNQGIRLLLLVNIIQCNQTRLLQGGFVKSLRFAHEPAQTIAVRGMLEKGFWRPNKYSRKLLLGLFVSIG